MISRTTWSFLLPALLFCAACAPPVGETPPSATSAPAPAAAQEPAAGLGGTSWQLVEFRGGDDTVLTPDDKAKYTIAFGNDGRLSARIDCNRGAGTWQSSGPPQLEFGPLALTRMACPPAPLNDRLARDWPYVRSYVMRDGHLFIALMADAGIYEFEPAAAPQ
jgi:para-nitrobenzyl esterase